MDIIHSVTELRSRLAGENRISLVPTMGNLHDGHIHLVNLARQHGDCVVVSIFVNPLQFGPNEDLDNYPRTLEQDCARLQAASADVVFAPSVSEMYPSPQTMTISAPPIADSLCGASRPGHFSGVATVVMKLFNLVQPQVAVFGKKDYQQLSVIRELIKQFNLPIEIVGGETVRESDGLAMSSRNGYLSPAQRQEAKRLHAALQLVKQAIQKGNHDFSAICEQTRQYLTQLGWIVDYIEVRGAHTLQPADGSEQQLVVLGAARLGKTRLIDNLEFDAAGQA
ncbi:MAG TPA: pantoate--beta-alanine ligase [Methylovorus sp.]|jgi:pantoate--beta-alanine ligase|nr:pantoate--beta-alanine ligase [Methylovorus sp.]